MIRVKTKVSYKGPVKFYRISWPLIDSFLFVPSIFELDNDLEFYYLTKSGEDTINGFILPENVDPSIIKEKILLEKDIDISDWSMTKVSDIPNPNYIRNHYVRGDGDNTIPLTQINKNNEKSELEQKITGDWILENKRLGVSLEFSSKIKVFDDYCYNDEITISLCFPEKTKIPYDPIKIMNKSNFIIFFIWKKILLGE